MKIIEQPSYGWSSAKAPHSCDYLSAQVVRVIKKLGVSRVLDLGSGNGVLCGALFDMGVKVVGIERDQGGVDISRRTYPAVKFHRFAVEDDPNRLLAEESPFDAVVSTEVIEHLYSPHLLPAYAAKVLKPAGRLILTTPYHGYLKNLALAVADKWDHHHTVLWSGGHIKFFSRSTLTALLAEHGFTVEQFIGVGRMPYLWKSMLIVARRSA